MRRREPEPAKQPESGRTIDGHFGEAIERPGRLTDDERQAARLNRLLARAEHDPRGAFFQASTQATDRSDAYSRELLFGKWAEADFAAALDFADRQPPGDLREALMASLALVVAGLSPAEAALIVMEDMAPGPRRTEALISVVHQWARRDPGAAMSWAGALAPGPLRERALEEIERFMAVSEKL